MENPVWVESFSSALQLSHLEQADIKTASAGEVRERPPRMSLRTGSALPPSHPHPSGQNPVTWLQCSCLHNLENVEKHTGLCANNCLG